MPRHHLVPQMYLKRFATESQKLVMVRREDLSFARPTSVGAACREAGFYEIPVADLQPEARDGHDPEAVERSLSAIEGATAPMLSNLVATELIPGLEDRARYQVALFVALQFTRTWTFRRNHGELTQIGSQHWLDSVATDDKIRKFLKARGEPTRPSDISEFRARLAGANRPQVSVSSSASTQAAVQLAVTQLHEEAFARNWHLRVFDEPVLVTSDNPVALNRAGPPGTPLPGFSTADAIYFPLDRRHLLSFERPRGKPVDRVTRSAQPGRAVLVNRLVAGQAERWIYHHPDDTHLLDGMDIPDRPAFVTEIDRVTHAQGEVRARKRVLRRKT